MPTRIIVADPSPSVQKIAHTVFPEPEFRIYPFEDGPSLLEAMENVRPDAVLVSLSLAAPGGGEIGRALRSLEGLGNFPIVGLRGTFEPVDMERVQAEDYDGIVQKPFESERLAASVYALITRKTGPSTLPEEPVWPSSGGPDGAAAASAPPQGAPGGSPDPGFREWVHNEIVGMEREIEKRVWARLQAELREWMSREGRGAGPKE